MLISTNESLWVRTSLLEANTAGANLMDLEAANIANAGIGRLTRIGMASCFALAGLMLLASLTMAQDPHQSQPVATSAAPSSL